MRHTNKNVKFSNVLSYGGLHSLYVNSDFGVKIVCKVEGISTLVAFKINFVIMPKYSNIYFIKAKH